MPKRDLYQAKVRASVFTNLPDLLRKLGCSPEPVFNNVGFELSQFEDPDTEVPYLAVSKLLEGSVEATGCDHLGLLLGIQAHPSLLGIPGFMLQVAPDVRSAIDCVINNLSLHDEGGDPFLCASNGISSFGYRITLPGAHAVDQIYDLSMVLICKTMRTICGENWNPTKVYVSRQPPKNEADYKRFFKSPIQFSADQNAVAFSSYWLDQKLEKSDPLLFSYLEQQAAELMKCRSTELIDMLHKYIGLSLPEQTCSITNAAIYLNTHNRTLERRLRDKGTSFSQERDKIRYQTAKDLLSSSNINNKQIAAVLGYKDATAFNRSFKRWSGTTPVRWKNQHKEF